MENEVGSIVPGKLANFTILEENPVTCDPQTIKDIKVLGTVHEGRVFPVSQAGGKAANLGPREPLDMIAGLRLSAPHMHDDGRGECACAVGSLLAALLYPDPAHTSDAGPSVKRTSQERLNDK
jgi:hypothetical protein